MPFVIAIRLRVGEEILFGMALNWCPIGVSVLKGCPCRICKTYLGQVGFIIT